MLSLYHSLTWLSGPALRRVLESRLRRGKEDAERLGERMGKPGRARPVGKLAWFHAASVGEAQSTLILVNALLARFPDLNIMVTTGTVTSAALMASRLPERAFHQYYPLDHPDWVDGFLNHWAPDLIFWMESELWPNMLRAIRVRNIHCVLVNARLSRLSYRRWKHFRRTAAQLLSAFDLCLAQTAEDAESFIKLQMNNVRVRDNLKYAADPLPHDPAMLAALKDATRNRRCWVFASTHAGEEQIACDIHREVSKYVGNLLTIIVPRHPERRDEIMEIAAQSGVTARLRGATAILPQDGDGVYIADTLGELGLFYRLCPVACIGRTFSNDGGGGHNPIEPAQLGCAVLHGPLTQNLGQIFSEMDDVGAAVQGINPEILGEQIKTYLTRPAFLSDQQKRGVDFAATKAQTLNLILQDIEPLLIDAGIMKDGQKCA